MIFIVKFAQTHPLSTTFYKEILHRISANPAKS